MPLKQPLYCIICGYERGGTTLVSEIIRQHPKLDGRFEIGFLLADTPQNFRSLKAYVFNLKSRWGLNDEDVDYICQAPDFIEAYRRLIECSNLPDKEINIYDKTPRYMERLPSIMQRVDVPVVCVVRDPRAVYYSMIKREPPKNLKLGRWRRLYRLLTHRFMPSLVRRITQSVFEFRRDRLHIIEFCERYLNRAKSYHQAKQQYPDRILLVQYESLCLNQEDETRKIYDFLNLDFDKSFLQFPTRPNLYVDRGGIRKDLINEYRGNLPRWKEKAILRRTRSAAAWHWKG